MKKAELEQKIYNLENEITAHVNRELAYQADKQALLKAVQYASERANGSVVKARSQNDDVTAEFYRGVDYALRLFFKSSDDGKFIDLNEEMVKWFNWQADRPAVEINEHFLGENYEEIQRN